MEESRKCIKCGEVKPFSELNKNSSTKGGIRSEWRVCQHARNVQYRIDNKEKLAAQRKEKAFAQPFAKPIESARSRATEQGVPFDIDAQYLEDIWTGHCPVYKTRLDLPGQSGLSGAWFSESQSSLDRLRPNKGYVRGNVVWISNKANMIKQQANSAEIQAVATWLQQIEEEIKKNEAD